LLVAQWPSTESDALAATWQKPAEAKFWFGFDVL
jgi:hypothetical protein